MKRNGRLYGSIILWSLLFIRTGTADSETVQTNEWNVLQMAESSVFFGQLNRTQAAELLERVINEGQDRTVMLKYLGVDPRVMADVHADQISVKFRTFDQFSQSPVLWSRMGSQMRDFNAKWQDISSCSASTVSNGDASAYWFLLLSSSRDQSSTRIPLSLQPGGYRADDALLAVSILSGRMPPSDTQERTAPAPRSIEPAASEQAMPGMAGPQEVLPVPLTALEPDQVDLKHPLPTSTAQPPQAPSTVDLRQKLQMLKQMYEERLIDSDVYKEKQREILDRL